ncbi:efflux RND transporter periplasmic adaptor subunit [Hydrogenophaga sp.]|uniref:efflux RND transporter periplasmic adaptor subunit n=1 Tax=Hydrogenophaga sp. TaxID=1904254 RepID=UPI003562F7BF
MNTVSDMDSSRPRRPWLKWVLLAALIVALGLGAARTLQKRKSLQEAAQQAAASLKEAPIYALTPQDVVVVQEQQLAQTVSASGSLKAMQSAVIKARAVGELQGLSKREGDTVRAGEVVARVDSTEAQARVRQAEQQAQSAQAQLSIARRTLDNNQSLVRQGFISNTALETARANQDGAEANHQAALAALAIAHKALTDTVLRSPLSGQVAARLVQNGERVGLDARILEVVDLSSFELEAALSPADAASVQVGQKAHLRVEGLAQTVEAQVARISPSVQAGSRSVLVYLKVPPAMGMRQGLFVQAQIVTGQRSALAVPLSTVRNDKPQPYVQVVRAGVVEHVTVAATVRGLVDTEPMVALTEVPAGTPVLRSQAGLIRAGTAVRMPDAPDAAAGGADAAAGADAATATR